MFNEYGTADPKLSDFCESIESEFVRFLDENNITDPVELRAVSNFVISGLGCVISERILHFAMEKRKRKRD